MDIELFMFKVMTALYNMNAPIVFKGAMVLKAIQYKTGNPSGLERGTKDIDGDWCGNPPTMSFLQKSLQQAVYTAGYSTVSVVATREYGKGKSAGFNFVYNNEVIAKIDLSIRNNPFGYNFAFSNGIVFTGQHINKIIADKICVSSQLKVVRRIKDIIDLYILSYSWNGYNVDILSIINNSDHQLEDFSTLLNRKSDLAHAYLKYKNSASILPFGTVYSRVIKFLEPFINNINVRRYWNGDTWN